MSLYNEVAERILAPTLDAVRGTRTMRSLRELDESQWWPRERIVEVQSKRLRLLIEHAYRTVPYYRGVMDERHIVPSDIRSAEDLRALPVLTRPDVQEHGAELMSHGFPSQLLRPAKTSGSTGTPLLFYGTLEDQRNRGFARSIRALGWAELRLGDRTATIGRPRVYSGRRDERLRGLGLRLQRSMPVYADSLSDNALPGVVTKLTEAHLDGIRSYPNALALIARFIRDAGMPSPSVRSILVSGEELLAQERRIIRDVFGREPYSDYSSHEVFEIAGECSAHDGLHIAAEDLVLEVVDDEGMPVPPGVEGRIVVTNLHNYGMPFIRYDLGDSGSMLAGACACGRTLPRLGTLIGRKNRFVTTRSGARIFAGTLFLDRLTGLGMRQYQIVQKTVDTVTMRLVPGPGASSASERASLEKKVLDMFQEKFGPELVLSVEFVDRIEPSRAGKHVFMLSDLAEE